MTEDTLARPRCLDCGKGLSFDDWSEGVRTCAACIASMRTAGPAATYVPGPRPRARAAAAPPLRRQVADEAAEYERLLAELPDELVDEIIAALEAEAEKMAAPASPVTAMKDVLEDIGFGQSPREWQWAVWGFAGGFCANVLVAKYAQMQAGASMASFLMPMLVGGLVAGSACAAIGWGLARLRDPQSTPNPKSKI
ncbi:MAG: hypothetical protein ACRDG3_03725 [Tepidiformaceae bacterium]